MPFLCPFKVLIVSPVSVCQILAVPSVETEIKKSESQLKAQSQTHFECPNCFIKESKYSNNNNNYQIMSYLRHNLLHDLNYIILSFYQLNKLLNICKIQIKF